MKEEGKINVCLETQNSEAFLAIFILENVEEAKYYQPPKSIHQCPQQPHTLHIKAKGLMF